VSLYPLIDTFARVQARTIGYEGVWAIPAQAQLTLQYVAVSDIHPDETHNLQYVIEPVRHAAPYKRAGYMEKLGAEMLAPESRVPPVILVRRKDGSYATDDGWHRVGIARHLGISHLPAYVHDLQSPTLVPFAASGYARLPRLLEASEIEQQVTGYSVGACGQIEPGEQLLLQMIPVERVHHSARAKGLGPEWGYSGLEMDAIHDTVGVYEHLEMAMRAGEAIDPIVARLEDGEYHTDDGWRRSCIAHHLGITHLPGYVHDPTLTRTLGHYPTGPVLSDLTDSTGPGLDRQPPSAPGLDR
jgi:hypothetical protein